MKKHQLYLITGFLGLALFLAGCGQKATKEETPEIKTENKAQEESYFSEKVADMFKKGQPLECRTEMENEEGAVTAVYYFDNSNERLRAEMKMVNKENGMTVNTVSITKDGWDYFWDDLMNKGGIKLKIEGTEAEAKAEANAEAPIDREEKFEFRCRPWQVDASKFELPADKTFQDISNLGQINSAIPTAAGNNSSVEMSGSIPDVCSFCGMLPEGPEKEECLSSCQ